MDRWMGMWVDGERGILFHMTLCRWGQPLTPTLCFSSPDGLCLWLGWQFLPLLGILAFLLIMQPPPPHHPPTHPPRLRLSPALWAFPSFAEAHSLARALSFAHLPTLAWHVNTSPSLMPSRFLRPFFKKNTTSFFTGWTKARCENKVKEDKNRYMPHSNKVKHQKYIQISQLFKHQWGSFKPALFSHTYNLFFSPVWHVKIFLTSKTTRFSAPLGFYVSMATSEGSSCYYHQSLTSQPSAFTFSALMDSTFFSLFWLTWQNVPFFVCVSLF